LRCEIEFEPKAVAKRDATGEEKRKKGELRFFGRPPKSQNQFKYAAAAAGREM